MAESGRLSGTADRGPHSKLRIGQFRLGADCDYEEQTLDVYTIERRSGAYKPGDD